MKTKLILSVTALSLLASAAAFAGDVSIGLSIGEPAPVYAAPVYVAPAYVSPYPSYYDPHHRRRDMGYWHDRRAHDDHGDHHR